MTRDVRLGDDIDDFCVRCKRLTNHVVVSVVNAAPAKVRCRTCHSDHDYRHEQAPPPKVDLRKAALYNEVLKKVNPGEAPLADLEVEDGVELDVDAEAAVAAEVDGEPHGDVEAEPQAEVEPAKPAKAKAKGRARK
jgi:hypothetical protein